MTAEGMTSNRPYLLRALYEWISDNNLTPHLLVDATAPGVRAPTGVSKEGRVVLNIAARAVSQLNLGADQITFLARFGGVSQAVSVPVDAVLAIYAQENGQGMMFPEQPDGSGEPEPPEPPTPPAPDRPRLRVVK